MPNENCLVGFKCPKCGYEDAFAITVTETMIVTDNGTGEGMGDTNWGDDSYCRCEECGCEGTVGDFTKSETKPAGEQVIDDDTPAREELVAKAEAQGWKFDGDHPGFWFHEPTWGSWKAAASWAGTDNAPNGPQDKPEIYDTLEKVLEAEFENEKERLT